MENPNVLYLSLIAILIAKAAYGNKIPDSAVNMLVIMNITEIICNLIIKVVLIIRDEWGEPIEHHDSPNFIHWDYKSRRMIEDPDENQ